MLLLGVVLALGATARPSFAATYYVDQNNPSCSNSGAGSQAQPYCTISAAVSARSAAGNTIIVNPGIYREQVTVAGSGTPGNPLVIEAAGPGVYVYGSTSLGNTSQWALSSGTVYVASSVTTSPVAVFADGAHLSQAASATPATAIAAGQWKYVSGQGLYVNLGGPNPGSRQAEAGARNYGFRLDRRSYVIVRGFEVRYTMDRSVYLTGPLNGTIIEENRLLLSGKNGVGIVSCSTVVIRDNYVAHHLDHGIYVQTTFQSTFEGNECTDNHRPATRAANGIYLTGSNNNRLIGNITWRNQDSGINLTSESTNNLFLNNISYLNGDHGFDHVDSPNNAHVHGVVYRNYKDGFSFEGDSPGGSVYNSISIENGQAVAPADGGPNYNLWVDPASSVGFQSDYNIFWNSNSSLPVVRFGSTAYTSLTTYRNATGRDLNSLQTFPMFADTAGSNFRLADGSPAIDRANSGVANWPATDIRGTSRNDDPATPNTGTGPVPYAEIGAYEFAPNVAPVARVSVDPDNGIPPLPVIASGATSTDDGTIVSYTFDFGDGTVIGPQSSPTASYTYTQLGEWALRLTVVDNRGGVDTASVPVTVTANLIGNSSFETNVTGWAPTSGSTLSRVSGGQEGSFAASIQGPATGTATFALNDSPNWINATNAINTRYRFTAWMRSTTHTGKAKIQVREFNANVLQATSQTAEITLTPSWQLFTVDHMSRMIGSTLDLQLVYRPNAGGEIFQMDNITARIVQLDRAPVVSAPAAAAATELQPLSFQITALDPDGEPAGLSAVLTGLPAGHNATFVPDANNTSGTFTWTPTFQDARPAPYAVIFRASNTLVGEDTTLITVSDVNPLPVVVAPDAVSAQEGSVVSFQVTASDPDGSAITTLAANFSNLPAGHNATFTPAAGNASGTFTWTPSYRDAPASYKVIFTATNTTTGADTATITVANVDLPPVLLAPPTFVAGEGALSTLTFTVADPDSQPIDLLVADLARLPEDNDAVFTTSADRRTATLTWTPDLGTPPGPYRVIFLARNALTSFDTTDVIVNRKPVVTAPAGVTVGETFALSVPITVSDADGDPIASLTANLSSLPAGHNAVFTPNPTNTGGTLTWTPTANDGRTAPYAVTFTATSGTLSGTATTSITVDQPPVVSAPATATVTEANLLTVSVTADDPDGQSIASLAANLSGLPAGHNAVFTVAPDQRSGTLTWTPTAADGRLAPYSVTFTATNALNGASTTSITVDQPPVVTAPALTEGAENAAITVNVGASDPDGQALASFTANLSGLPAGHNAVFTPGAGNSTGTLTWTPTYDDSGTYVVIFTATNPLASGSASATIHVSNVDRAPVVTAPATTSVGEGELLTTVVTVVDPDGDAIGSLTANLSSLPGGHNAAFTPNASRTTGTLTWTPNVGDGGSPPFVVAFTAVNALTGSASTAITVDRHPVVTAPASASGAENTEIVVNVTATDPDGQPIDSLTVDLSALPAGHGAVFTPGAGNTSGTLRWTPSYFAAPGPYPIHFRAKNAISGLATTSIAVSNVDRRPVLECPAVAMGGERVPLTMVVTVADPDLEPITSLTADLASLPVSSNATFTTAPDLSSGTLTWTPLTGDGDASPYIVTFMASNALEVANATAIIVDRYPRITVPATATVQETTTIVVPVSVADPDLDEVLSLTADLSELPAGHNATFTSSPDHLSGTFIWTPTYDDARGAPYRVRVIAANALAETSSTMITVTGRDRAPLLVLPPNTIGGESSEIVVNVTVSDPEGDPIDALTVDLSALPAGNNATFTPGANNLTGVFRWTPTPSEAPGPYDVVFTAVANGLSSSSIVSIKVDRHPAIVAPATVNGTENAMITVNVTVSDPDLDAITSLTADFSGLPAGHDAVFTPNASNTAGTLTWTPTFADAGGPYAVSITAINALSITETIALNVANVDRAPIVTSTPNLLVAENVQLTTTVTATDPDGDPISSLTADLSALPGGHDAVFTPNASRTSGTLTWKPKTGDARLATYDVVFQATNALTGRDTTAIKVDQKPVVTVTPSSLTVGEGTLVTLGVTVTDPDGQPITSLVANLTGLPAGHNAVFTTSPDNTSGTFTWTPTYTDFRGAPYTVTFTATNNLSAGAIGSIRVNNTDRAPVVTAPATVDGIGGSLVSVGVTAIDPDGESISSLVADLSSFPAGHGATFTPNPSNTGGTLSWTPALGVPRGPHRVTFTATNALPGSASTDVSIDQRPVVTAATPVNANEGAEVAFDITASDLNGDAITSLSADLSGLPAGHNAVFTPGAGNTTGHFSWTPTYSDAGGPYTVTFSAANALTGTSNVSINVANVDRAPLVTAPGTQSVAEGAVMTVNVAAADPDGQPITSLTANLSALPAGHNAVFTPGAGNTSGTLTWTPTYTDAGGPYTVTFTAANAMSGASSTAITVSNTDRAPIVVAPVSASGGENSVITIEVTASDPDNQAISFLTADLAGLPEGNNAVFTTNPTRTAGTLTWTPTFDDGRAAVYNVTFTAFNGMAGVSTTGIHVNDTNRNPVITAPSATSVTENSPLTINVTVADPDGEAISTLSADLSELPAGHNAVFTPNANATAGTFTWTPSFSEGRAAPYNVTFNASNSSNGSKVTAITVNNLDRLPVVTAPATATVIENQLLTVNVTAADPDGEAITALTADLSALPAGHGATFTPNGNNTAGTLSWTPSPSAVRAAPYNLVFRATNALTGSSTTAVTVQPANVAPIAALVATPPSVVAPAMVTLSAAGSVDTDGSIVSYTFDFGDGQSVGPQASPTASHEYAAGFRTARVIVVDNLGGRDTATVDVNANLVNLVTNFGFETNTTGWTTNGTVSLARVAGGHSGGFQLRLTGGSSTSALFGTHDSPNVVSTVAGVGRRYRFGAWVRSDAHTGRINLEVREFSGTSTQVGSTAISSPVILSPTWQYLTADYVVTTAGTNLDLRVICTPNASNTVWFLDDVSIALVPLGDQAPVVTAPAAASVVRNNAVTINVTASDPDGQAIASLLGNLSGLPAGHNATFTPNGSNTGGTFTWTPTPADIREAPYNVTFTASNALSGTATTAITVTDSSALVNLVSNPGFETDLSGWLAYTGTLTRVAGGRTGGFSARMQGSSTSSFGIDDAVLTVPSTPIVGARYRFSAWIRSDNSTRGVKIRIYEKAGSSQVGSTFYSPEVTLSTSWKEVTVDYLSQRAGSSIDFKITNYPAASGEVFFLDDVFVAYVPPAPIAPLVGAPASILGAENAPVVVSVTATSQDGQPISSLTADLTGLPAGHNAVFTPGANNTTGTLTWTPAAAHASATPYNVTFRAVGSLTGTKSTAITVADTSAGANLATNPGFESSTTGWAANGTVTLSRVTTGQRTGAGALRLVGGTSATALFGAHDSPNFVSSTAGVGRVYRFGAWVRGNTVTDTGSVALEIREFSGTSTQVGTTRVSTAAKLTTGWQFVTVDYTVTTAGTNLDLRVIDTPKKASETWFLDDVSIVLLPSGPPPPQAPVVVAPAAQSVLRNHLVTVNVTASDADGPAIASLTANLSGLPAGHDAVFTPNGTNTAGTFTWTPKPADIRPTPYLVIFTAANALSGSDTTAITVTDSATVVNLVTNPGFETDLSGWSAYGSATLTRVAGGRSGGWCVRAAGSSTSSFGIDDLPNTVTNVPAVGTVYRFSAWIRSDNSTRAVKIRIYELSGSTQIGSTFYSPEVTLSPTWKQVTVDYTTQRAGTQLNLRITDYPSVSGEVFFIDDVSVEQLPPGGVLFSSDIESAAAPIPAAESTPRVFAADGHRFAWDSVAERFTLQIEGADGPDMDGALPQARMEWGGRTISASTLAVGEDHDRNGFEETVAGFAADQLRDLLADAPADARHVPVTIVVTAGEARRTIAAVLEVERPALVFGASFAPNPFKSTGTLSLTITQRGPVRAEVFDVNGRRVRMLMEDGDLKPGKYRLPVDARDSARGRMEAGVYFYRVEAREGVLRGRFVLMR